MAMNLGSVGGDKNGSMHSSDKEWGVNINKMQCIHVQNYQRLIKYYTLKY